MNGNAVELSVDAIRDVLRHMIWESLGKPKDEEYDRIAEKLRGW